MTAKYTSNQEKQLVNKWLQRYARANQSLTVIRYVRIMRWLYGETYQQIAEKDGVTAQAVAHSVKRDVKKILEFAKENDKRIVAHKQKGSHG